MRGDDGLVYNGKGEEQKKTDPGPVEMVVTELANSKCKKQKSQEWVLGVVAFAKCKDQVSNSFESLFWSLLNLQVGS